MSCNCSCAQSFDGTPIFKITSFTSTTSDLTLECSTCRDSLTNGQKVIICIDLTLPTTATVVPVFVKINDVLFRLLDGAGNDLQNDQIKSKRVYSFATGTEGKPHFRCCNPLPVSSTNPVTIPLLLTDSDGNVGTIARCAKTTAKETK